MKVREMSDGSHQFLPEPGDREYPIAPVLPPKSVELVVLEGMEAEVAATGSTDLKAKLATLKALRKLEEDQHAANVAAHEKNKPPVNHVGSPAGAKLLSASDKAKQPWLKAKEK